MVPVEEAPPVELPAPVEVAPVELESIELPVDLAAPVELPVELAPALLVAEPPVEDALAAVLDPFAPIEPEIAPRRQAAFRPTSNRQAMIRHFTLEDCAEQPNPSPTGESHSYDFRAGTEAGATGSLILLPFVGPYTEAAATEVERRIDADLSDREGVAHRGAGTEP